MNKEMILWAIVFGASVLLEMFSMQLISIWFAAGAFAAFIVSFFQPFGVQIAVFIAVTGIMLIATRPLVKKLHKPAVPTNHELDLGENAVVIEDINPAEGTGRVRLKGVDWSAVSADGRNFKTGETVTVLKVSGACLTVGIKTESIKTEKLHAE